MSGSSATRVKRPIRRVGPDEYVDYPAPTGEAVAALRRLLPPVRVERRAS